jgi:hypothetical protein
VLIHNPRWLDAGFGDFYAFGMRTPTNIGICAFSFCFRCFFNRHPILVSPGPRFVLIFQIAAVHIHPEMVFVSTYFIYRRSLHG